jgi:mRNA export factor
VPNYNVLLSGGWDGKLNLWDLRSPNPALSCDMGKRVYTMSLSFPLLVVGFSDRYVSYFNMNKVGQTFQPEATFESHLKYQTRRIATFPERDGYAIGSIEGRVAIKYVDLNRQPEINQESKSMNSKDDFAFRCHRNNEEVYPVNDIAFNPLHGTFCTGGGDGTWIIWDKDSRSRLKQGTIQNKAPITALDYSSNGDLLAYASGYDWAKGVAYENTFQPKLSIHFCPDSEKKKKAKKP